MPEPQPQTSNMENLGGEALYYHQDDEPTPRLYAKKSYPAEGEAPSRSITTDELELREHFDDLPQHPGFAD